MIDKESAFQNKIISFYKEQGRDFPWRKTEDDFYALTAEILLQKTTAEQVKPVYDRFCQYFNGPEEAIEGNLDFVEVLGLAKRKNYIKCLAQFMIAEKDLTQENLLQVKGLGRYSVNVFLATHKERDLPVVDSNVEGVFRKEFSVEDKNPPYRNEKLWVLAEDLLPKKNIKEYTLGLLDYGHYLKTNSN